MSTFGMAPLYTRCPDLALEETRVVRIQNLGPALPLDDYALGEHYCTDPDCDCQRVLICVNRKGDPNRTLCTINFGWESEAFYIEEFSFAGRDDALDMARDVVSGALDPLNEQCEAAERLLECFRDIVAADPDYVSRLARHYVMFRNAGPTEQAQKASHANNEKRIPNLTDFKVPQKRRGRFTHIAESIVKFGHQHLDDEITGFALELWARVCRKKDAICERGKPEVWAASAVHAIARMNFLYDRTKPNHIEFGDVCDHFGTKKTTVGNKATQIERTLKLSPRGEPGLVRRDLLERLTIVRSPEGLAFTFKEAKKLGYLPPDTQIEDIW